MVRFGCVRRVTQALGYNGRLSGCVRIHTASTPRGADCHEAAPREAHHLTPEAPMQIRKLPPGPDGPKQIMKVKRGSGGGIHGKSHFNTRGRMAARQAWGFTHPPDTDEEGNNLTP